MSKKFNFAKNYQRSKNKIGYVTRKEAKQADYDRIGFMSGLEVHQQIDTERKLFCACPGGQFHNHDIYDAEIIRHMRPTLSELGEYDGTALMEFRTRKEIIYRIKNETTCTYDIDDTPPFPINRDALEKAIEISLLSKLNIVGEVHITRKQYLDGSIPAGFQRTAIIGVEGEISMPGKNIRLIQLSLEEDSCREISDIGHTRVYNTDRLGMPLIETVTYPDFVNPEEVRQGCDYIRFLNRSTGKVRTGMGAGRQDVNVSCRGGHRVEIKGVAHTKWIPELTHREAFRQWALLNLKEELLAKVIDSDSWKVEATEVTIDTIETTFKPLNKALENGYKLYVVNLPWFKGALSHFTMEKRIYADEISERLKVIACLDQPNMTHSEDFNSDIEAEVIAQILAKAATKEEDAQIIFWAPENDVATAIETIEERCIMAFEGIPGETRKSFEDGNTIFERVLPGADRMYPDTDSAPIPIADEYIDELRTKIPEEVIDFYNKLKEWQVPEDTYTYILKKNLFPLVRRIHEELDIPARFVGTLLAHRLKYIEGQFIPADKFDYNKIYKLLAFLKRNKIDYRLAFRMLPEFYKHPKMDCESLITSIKFKRISKEEILDRIPLLASKFEENRIREGDLVKKNWIMGQLHMIAIGNIDLCELGQIVESA